MVSLIEKAELTLFAVLGAIRKTEDRVGERVEDWMEVGLVDFRDESPAMKLSTPLLKMQCFTHPLVPIIPYKS